MIYEYKLLYILFHSYYEDMMYTRPKAQRDIIKIRINWPPASSFLIQMEV